jgi:hypothetical protein
VRTDKDINIGSTTSDWWAAFVPPGCVWLTAAFVYYIYMYLKFHNSQAAQYGFTVTFRVRPTNQPTITSVALCHKKVERPCSKR